MQSNNRTLGKYDPCVNLLYNLTKCYSCRNNKISKFIMHYIYIKKNTHFTSNTRNRRLHHGQHFSMTQAQKHTQHDSPYRQVT